MSTYYLHVHPTHSHADEDGVSTFTPVSVHLGGEWVPGSAFVHLMTTPRGAFAVVSIRAESQLVNEPTRAADFEMDSGARDYHFTSHNAALAFLRHLYGIASTEVQHSLDLPWPRTMPNRASVSRRVPALLARNVAPFPLPRPIVGTTERATFFDAPVYPHPDHSHPRNTP